MRSKKNDIRRLTDISLITGAALIIFIIELRFPDIIPVPGVKLGLANVITVYALYRYRWTETALIVVARVLLGAFFASNPSALVYSLSGAAFCLAGTIFLRRIIPIKFMWLCSAIGAILHNTGQIAAAALFMRSYAVFAYYPILIVSGVIAGVFTGLCAGLITERISKSGKGEEK